MEYFEEQQDDSTIYAEGESVPPPPKEQIAPLLQSITSAATGVKSEGPVDVKQLVNDSYKQVATKNFEEDKAVANSAVARGDAFTLQNILEKMQKDGEEMRKEQANHVERVRVLVEEAYQNVAFSSPGVVLNNTPEQIAKAIESNTPSITTSVLMEQINKEQLTVAGFVGQIATSISPFGFSENVAIADVAKQYAGGRDVSRLSYGDTIEALRASYRDQEGEAARVSWLQNLNKDLMNTWSLNKAAAAGILNEIVSEEEPGAIGTTLQTAGPIASAIPPLAVIAKGVKAARTASKIAKAIDAEVVIANAGGKAALQADLQNKVLRQTAVGVAKEISGVQTAIDLKNLTASALGKALPNSITLPAGKIQEAILAKVDDTVSKIKNSLRADNVRSAEMDDFLKEVTRTYDKAIDPSVHLVNIGRMEDDPLTVVGTVLRGTKGGDVFLTEEAAKEAVKLLEIAGVRGLRIVKDVGNNMAKVSDETKAAITLERDALEAQLLELKEKGTKARYILKDGKIVPKPTPEFSFLPDFFGGVKPTLAIGAKKFSLEFDNDLDKVLYTLSQKKNKKYSDWVEANTGWNKLEIEDRIKQIKRAATIEARGASPGALKIPQQIQVSDLKLKSEAVLEAKIDLLDSRLKAAKDIENGLSSGWLIEEKIQKSFDISSIGKFKEEDIQSMMRISLGDRALGASEEVYHNRLIGVLQEDNLRQSLVNIVSEPLKALGKREKVLLNSILVRGDKEGVVYNSVELAGLGMKTEKEQIAYFAIRKARDLAYQIRNTTAANSLTLKGWKQVWHPALEKYKDEWKDFQLFGKEVDDASVVNKFALDPNSGKVERLSADRIKQLKDNGFTVIEFDTKVPMAGIERKRVILPVNGLQANRIETVIPYRAGEFSRMYSDEYFIRLKPKPVEAGAQLAEDAEELSDITHRTAKSMREAKMYAAAYEEAARQFAATGSVTQAHMAKMTGAYGWNETELIDFLEKNKNYRIDVNYTRTKDDYLDSLTSYSRNFTSERGKHLQDITGNSSDVLDPLDALAAEISNTAYVATHTEWIDVSVKRWFETAKHILPQEVQRLSPESAYSWYMKQKGTYFGQSQEELFIRRVADQIAEGMAINGKEQRLTLGLIRSFTEGLDEATNGNFETVGAFMRQADVPSFLKTFSFHTVFGGNPIQLFIQGLNAFNAVTVSPAHGLKAARSYAFYRAALASDNPDVINAIAKVNDFASLGLGSVDDFKRSVAALKRSGLISNLESSSLYGMNLGKYSLVDGAWGTARKVSSWFFKEGEEASRVVSFDIARREWIAANPGKVWDSDAALKEIIVRQDALTGTMTNANAAWWQKGAASIPMQFMQFPVKFALNILNATFKGKSRTITRTEALRMVTGNLLFFGSAGLLHTNLAQSIFGDSLQDLSEDEKLALTQGLVSSVIDATSQAFTGEELKLAIGDRVSPFKGYVSGASAVTSTAQAVLGLGDGLASLSSPGLWETLAGAPGGALKRAHQNIGEIARLYTVDYSVTPEKLGESLKILAQIPSAGRNFFTADSAENLYNSMVKNGTVQYKLSDKELFFKRYFGIDSVVASDYRLLKESSFKYETRMRNKAKSISDFRTQILEAYNRGDDETAKQLSGVLNAMLLTLHEGDRYKIEAMLKEPDFTGSDYQKARNELLLRPTKSLTGKPYDSQSRPFTVLQNEGR